MSHLSDACLQEEWRAFADFDTTLAADMKERLEAIIRSEYKEAIL